MAKSFKRLVPLEIEEVDYVQTKYHGDKTAKEADLSKVESELNKFKSNYNTFDIQGWFKDENSPIVERKNNKRHLKMKFDLNQYNPNEIEIKTIDNQLILSAKHEEKTDSGEIYREINRQFVLPKGTDTKAVKSHFTQDGVLTLEAPLPEAEDIITYFVENELEQKSRISRISFSSDEAAQPMQITMSSKVEAIVEENATNLNTDDADNKNADTPKKDADNKNADTPKDDDNAKTDSSRRRFGFIPRFVGR